jgi:uncharacterized membrane protein YhdT
MPTKKQRRRAQKERRHEYETVWVDEEGNELEEPPDDLVEPPPKRDGTKPKAKATQQRGGRSVRVPPAPSWERAARRSLILGVVIFAVFYLLGAKNGQHSFPAALGFAGLYTLLFIPLGYMFDRFAHNRWQRRAEQESTKRPARKR